MAELTPAQHQKKRTARIRGQVGPQMPPPGMGGPTARPGVGGGLPPVGRMQGPGMPPGGGAGAPPRLPPFQAPGVGGAFAVTGGAAGQAQALTPPAGLSGAPAFSGALPPSPFPPSPAGPPQAGGAGRMQGPGAFPGKKPPMRPTKGTGGNPYMV